MTLFLIETQLNTEIVKKVCIRRLLHGLTLRIIVGASTLTLILVNWIHA